jgi:predicted patatin/cPLA2 family phospholipase
MDDLTETASEDWVTPEPPTDMEELRREVRSLQIYVKTLSQSYGSTWKEIVRLRNALQELGIQL